MTKPAPLTRTKLDHCSVADCPRPDSEAFHRNICGHWDRVPTHLHAPKKGSGGNNPKSKIRACACQFCHDACDNFGGSSIVQTKDGKRYIGWQGHDSDPIKRKILWDVPLDAHELVKETDEREMEELPDRSGSSQRRAIDIDAGSYVDGDTRSLRRRHTAQRTDSSAASRDGVEQDAGYALREQGIDFTECTFDDWKSAWVQIAGLTRNKAWWVGDAWNYAEERWPEAHGQIVEELTALAGLRIETVSNYANVAKAFPRERRRALSFDHHATVYKLPPKEADEWLTRAEAEGLSSTELRALVHPPEPKPKRWSVEELREALGEALYLRNNVHKFLNWLEEQQDG